MKTETAIFLHIHKTAGTTLNQIATRQYAPGTIVDLYGTEKIETFKKLPEVKKLNLRLIRGHMGFGLHEFLPQSATYFTLLREPIERTISQYYFIRSTFEKTHQQGVIGDETYQKISSMTFGVFVSEAFSDRYDNLQIRALAGSKAKRYDGIVTDDVFELAKKNLREKFSVVGVVEDFERSLLLLKRYYGWSNIFYFVRNPTKNRPRRSQLTSETINRIHLINEFDLRLYDFAIELLGLRIDEQGPSFDEELRGFESMNMSFRGKVGFLVSTGISKTHRWLFRARTRKHKPLA